MLDDLYYCPTCGYEADCDDCVGDFDCLEDAFDAIFNGYDGSCKCGEPDCFTDCDDCDD